MDRSGWQAVAVGAALAALTVAVPLLSVLIGYFAVLVHEFGHAIAGWLLGFPSIPAFDFTYGGGVTTRLQRSLPLVFAVYAVFAVVLWRLRRNRLSLFLGLGVVALYTALELTRWHEAVILAMGHGGELLFAALFLHRALSGRACTLAVERPLYAWIGFYIVFHDLGFAWGLMTSPFARQAYAQAKGGGHWMDFSRLAREFFGVRVRTVAAGFFAACLVTPIVPLFANLQRDRLAQWLARLARVE